MPKPKPEIMAPAGNWTCLHAALQAGADAVYFGLNELNMRSSVRNFRPSDLPRVAARVHAVGARAYLALNTIVYESELPRVDRLLRAARDAAIDAVICSDLAVVQKAGAIGLPVAVSTQFSLSNSESVLFFHRACGVRRFVLARECTLAQIRAIRRRLLAELGEAAQQLEIEVFAHGAMCVSVSGRCFLSEERLGKSANRGECQQPCRREYQLLDDEGKPSFRLGSNYLLSPEDLCTMPFLDKLLDAGVASLKIEGRARTPEYVATVTRCYRRAVDFYCENRGRRGFAAEFDKVKEEAMRELDTVYHRGLSSGFFLGRPVEQWANTSGSRARQSKRHVGEVVNYYRKAGAVEIWVRDIEFAKGDELMIQGPTTGLVRFKVEDIQIERASRDRANRGERVAVPLREFVRRRDRVFLVTQSSGGRPPPGKL